MNFEELVESIPNYKRFFKVEELNQRAVELAERYPKIVEIDVAGKSRKGRDILVMKIGSGEKTALAFGCPHPNEPIGAMMLDWLSEELARNDELRESLGYTWYIVKSIDVDGTVLNEGWFDNPQSIACYAENFYRPASHQQVEWTFPVHYKTLHFDAPLPETQVLMKLIEEEKPQFMYSLHNAGFGGVYYYITDGGKKLFEKFERIPHMFSVPLALGEPEVPYLEELSKAVYKLSPITDEYDYLEKHLKADPASVIQAGACSDEYAARVANTFSLVCEVPYYYDSRIEDLSPADITRKEARNMNLRDSEEHLRFLTENFDKVCDLVDESSPFYEPISQQVRLGPKHLEAERNWIETDTTLLRPATVAEVFDNTLVSKFYRTLSLGIFKRLIKDALRSSTNQKLVDTLDRLEERFQANLKFLNDNLNYKAIPIKDLVSIQLLAGLHTSQYVLGRM
ncbi:MAG: peptidase M14 [Thermotogae bacterium]|nr:MAG: peptidase M14 [Thermotogota bacterium]